MNSNSLKKYGFKKWRSFNMNNKRRILDILPYSRGVYVIKNKGTFGRFKGKSDIIYIGSSISKNDGLRGRISFYFNPGSTQETSKRIHDLLKKTNSLAIAFVVRSQGTEAKKLEKKLRCKYEIEHGELPPLNRNA